MTKSAPNERNHAGELRALDAYQHWRRVWLAAGIAMLACVLLFVSSAWTDGWDYWTKAIGVSLIGAAILGRLWCTLYIGGRKSDMVVSAGPYSIMRNPLYFFSTLGVLGAGAQSGSIIVAFFLAILCVAAFHIVIRREERFLAGQFGADYQNYLAQVPRFWPNLRLFRDDPLLSVHPKRMYATLMDGLVFFAALPAFAAVEYLQRTGAVPVLLRLY
jgi:protein-S-isoprenylcysteine O-methyltransferase Ste14